MKKYIFLIGCMCLTGVLLAQMPPNGETDSKIKLDWEKVLARKNVWGEIMHIGNSQLGKPIYGYYYNRNASDSALIIAGVHGSEFYGVDVAYALKARLDSLNPVDFKWKMVIIPELFVDNVQLSRSSPLEENYHRCTCVDSCERKTWNCDPNRQMPTMKRLFEDGMNDALGRPIELENQHLLQFVQIFNPSRIASIHCKNEQSKEEIGIYADPRVNADVKALGFETDSAMAIEMARSVIKNGGRIEKNIKPGNKYFAIYPKDPPASVTGVGQPRSYDIKEGKGVTFGTWASTEIIKNGVTAKQAATVITLELPQFHSFYDKKHNVLNLSKLYTNTNAYVKSLLEVFLSNQ